MKTCKNCYSIVELNVTSCYQCSGTDFLESDAVTASEPELFEIEDGPLYLDPTKPQYKVITQKDRFFGGKFNPSLIERALNEYAQEGWKVISAVSADIPSLGIPGIGQARNELIIILEKLPDD
jgi:Domain of unknown function (DUF4177)